MSTIRLATLSVFWVVLIAFAGCASDDEGPASSEARGGVTVTGEVKGIQNDMAVDGGITLDVDLLRNGTDRLIFGGLATVSPPSEEQLKLYDVVRRVEIGDVVRAEGERGDYGIILEKLWILEGRP